MNIDSSLISYFLNASPVVKVVMVLLGLASVMSWSIILQRYFVVRETMRRSQQFEQRFWAGDDLSQLYSSAPASEAQGMEVVFRAGFREFVRFRKQAHAALQVIMQNTARAMVAAKMREQDRLEQSLSILAMVGSTSPYVGLFGTVWGIMQSFRALASVQQATISMVAPGIAEALIATALGLFAAIPAVIAYNRYVNDINRLTSHFDVFQEEFTNVLYRQAEQQNAQSHSHQEPSLGVQ